jgi:proline-specific peptidase
MRRVLLLAVFGFVLTTAAGAAGTAGVHPIAEGYVDANGVLLYFKAFGDGPVLLVLHGGPGASHDYFLPHLLPLARHHRLVFLDERGSGRSQKLQDPSGYTIENMADDVEAARKALNLGRVMLLGHSFGGALAQAYALKYPQNLTRLILASTWSSTKKFNQIFAKMRDNMPADVRARIDAAEKKGLFGNGKPYEQNRYTADYMIAAWGEGYFPYLYQARPDANYDPIAAGNMSWDLYRQMWGSDGEYVVSGNLTSVEYTERLSGVAVPTLLIVGDHDEIDPELSRDMLARIPGSKLVVLPKAGHMTFVDQPDLFVQAVDEFLK